MKIVPPSLPPCFFGKNVPFNTGVHVEIDRPLSFLGFVFWPFARRLYSLLFLFFLARKKTWSVPGTSPVVWVSSFFFSFSGLADRKIFFSLMTARRLLEGKISIFLPLFFFGFLSQKEGEAHHGRSLSHFLIKARSFFLSPFFSRTAQRTGYLPSFPDAPGTL